MLYGSRKRFDFAKRLKGSNSFSELLLFLSAIERLTFNFITLFSGSYTTGDRGFLVHQALSFCKLESPCVHKIL